jgi:glutamine synthetase
MELTIMEIGLTISNTVSEWNHGQMELNMKAPTLMGKRKVKEN